MHLKIKLHGPEVVAPTRGHASDAGLDLTAYGVEQKTSDVFLFDTGISVQPEPGFYTEVVPRSSIIKTDFMLANSIGIIDPDYRGRILVPLRYLGSANASDAAQALLGQRIAQLIVRKQEPCTVEIVEDLEGSVRGSGGFGSTGTH
ncbi:MAG: dUTP diphosphatase [bacterium]|jgi:dUTP pyrophosphatase